MDADRFDELARGLARAASRRSLLRAAAALSLAAPLASPANDAAAKRRCSPFRCGGRNRCCVGLTCCGTACADLQYDDAHCGACGAACAEGTICREGACTCLGVPCGDVCCGEQDACLAPETGSCGACPAGGTLDDGVACGANPGFYGQACTCVTSVDGVTVCSSGWGVCVDCVSDRECTLALGAQAVCVPAAGECARWRAGRACVDATCFGGAVPEPGEATPAGRVVRLGR